MRTTWKMAGVIALMAPMMSVACGDDTTGTGGAGGEGGEGGGTTTTTTTTSQGGAGGTGGGDPVWADQCPGGSVIIDPGQTLSLPGDTSTGTDFFTNFCGDADGDDVPDQVIQLEVTGACTLQIQLDDGDWDGLFSFRTDGFCTPETGGEDVCVNFIPDLFPGNGESYSLHAEPGTYHIIVDGVAAGDEGPFTLSLVCAAPECGDGVLNPGEECDYGGGATDDGCVDPGQANECTAESATAGDTCDDALAIAINGGDALELPVSPPLFNTLAAGDDYQHAPGTCVSEGGGRDHVFAVTPAVSGQLTMTVGEDYDGAAYCVDFFEPQCLDQHIYVRTGDCATGTQVACFDPELDFFVTTGTLAVTAGTTYYVFVDGYNPEIYANGPYILQLSLAAN